MSTQSTSSTQFTIARLAALCLLLAAPFARAAEQPTTGQLDFTLRHRKMLAEADAVESSYFTDGESRIFLRFPYTWKIFSTADALDLAPGASATTIRLEKFPGARLLTLDQPGGRELVKTATAQFPKDATKTEEVSVEMNPLPIFGWQTMEATFRYEEFGEPLRRSVMYLSMLPGRVVELTVVAPEKEFDKIHKQARQMMSSWFEPSRDLPPELQRKYESADPIHSG